MFRNQEPQVKVPRGTNFTKSLTWTDDGGPIIFVLKKIKPITSCYFTFLTNHDPQVKVPSNFS